MNFFQLSELWGLIILLVIVIRAVAIHHIPKLLLCILWAVVALCLLITLFIEFPLVECTTTKTTIWFIGSSVGLFYFSISYIQYKKKLRRSISNNTLMIQEWMGTHKLRRKYEVRISTQITSSSVSGILHPIILLPQKFNQENAVNLQKELTCQYVHIQYFDPVIKFLFAIVLCIYWFNPLIWVMCILANRDIDLFCETCAISSMSETGKFSYALFLINNSNDKTSTGNHM